MTRPGCGLCREMKAVLERLRGELPHELVERNIADDPELLRRYATEIPVLLSDETEVARHRVAEAELRARLTRLWGSERPASATG
jgi:hypothetical protein